MFCLSALKAVELKIFKSELFVSLGNCGTQEYHADP